MCLLCQVRGYDQTPEPPLNTGLLFIWLLIIIIFIIIGHVHFVKNGSPHLFYNYTQLILKQNKTATTTNHQEEHNANFEKNTNSIQNITTHTHTHIQTYTKCPCYYTHDSADGGMLLSDYTIHIYISNCLYVTR